MSNRPYNSQRPTNHTCPCGDRSCKQRAVVEREINRHGDAVRFIALGITHDMHLAEDLSQNLLVKLLANPHCYNDEGVFLGFAKRALSNTYINWIRDNKRFASYDDMIDPERDFETRRVSIEDLMDISSNDEGIEEMICFDLIAQMRASLTGEVERLVFHHLCTGLGGTEIAQELNMNTNTVHGVIRRVRQSLFREFPVELELMVAPPRPARPARRAPALPA
jgi:RNA polymerase sigma factor (sigma-70 family)